MVVVTEQPARSPALPSSDAELRRARNADIVTAFLTCPRFPVSHPALALVRRQSKGCAPVIAELADAIRRLGIDRARERAGLPALST